MVLTIKNGWLLCDPRGMITNMEEIL